MTACITVIIVNFNGEPYLRDCLNALAAQTFRDFEVLLVDNGSSDGSPDLVAREFPWVRMICLDRNTGFAAGNNTGLLHASSSFIVTLNNDTIPDSRWLEELHRAAEANPSTGMVGSKILLGREGSEFDSAGMLVYPDGMTRQRARGETDRGQYDSLSEILFPSACAALYRRTMLEQTGFFDEEFVSYCEDADLGLRARLAGWNAVFAPRAVVRHLYSQTGGGYSAFKAYHIERNHIWVLLKNLPLSWLLLFPFSTFWRYLVALLGLLSGRGSAARFSETTSLRSAAGVIASAYAAAFRSLLPMLRKRRAIAKHRKISHSAFRALLLRHRISAAELMLRD